jgi:hypothetical protein
MRRTLALVLVSAAALFFSVRAHAEDTKCTIATKGDSPMAKACATGGRKEAAKVMKDMVKAAKAKGTEFKCVKCHKDLDNYELTPEARDDLGKLMAAAK